jgi:hypothetical protein
MFCNMDATFRAGCTSPDLLEWRNATLASITTVCRGAEVRAVIIREHVTSCYKVNTRYFQSVHERGRHDLGIHHITSTARIGVSVQQGTRSLF